MDKKEVKKFVKKAYGKIAQKKTGCGCGSCDTGAKEFAKSVGYSDEELKNIPPEANLALSCGNPTALASLKAGETVLDLGSGAGFDCFLAASRVGPKGRVIGVDMTEQMVKKARNNAQKNQVENVDFRLGEIENLPVEDNSVDVIISNCVINLSPDKEKVCREALRALKPGGRIAISDMALLKPLPEEFKNNPKVYAGCVAGAILIDEYQKIVERAGFKEVKITIKGSSNCVSDNTKDPIGRSFLEGVKNREALDGYVASVNIEGRK